MPQEDPVRGLFRAGENIERRNHYMDLAGIENFSSKFEDTGTETSQCFHIWSKAQQKHLIYIKIMFSYCSTVSPSVKSRHKAHSALQHHHVVIKENSTTPDSLRGFSSPCFQKSKTISVGKERNGGEGKSHRLHSPHFAPCCRHVPHSQPAAQRTHSKRLRSKVLDVADSPYLSCEAPASPAKRHEHHHQHEHHHHHHHHHYRPS